MRMIFVATEDVTGLMKVLFLSFCPRTMKLELSAYSFRLSQRPSWESILSALTTKKPPAASRRDPDVSLRCANSLELVI